MGQVRRSSGGGGLLGCPRADQISGRCITYGGRGPSMTYFSRPSWRRGSRGAIIPFCLYFPCYLQVGEEAGLSSAPIKLGGRGAKTEVAPPQLERGRSLPQMSS